MLKIRIIDVFILNIERRVRVKHFRY